jgi:hypothetical protein
MKISKVFRHSKGWREIVEVALLCVLLCAFSRSQVTSVEALPSPMLNRLQGWWDGSRNSAQDVPKRRIYNPSPTERSHSINSQVNGDEFHTARNSMIARTPSVESNYRTPAGSPTFRGKGGKDRSASPRNRFDADPKSSLFDARTFNSEVRWLTKFFSFSIGLCGCEAKRCTTTS